MENRLLSKKNKIITLNEVISILLCYYIYITENGVWLEDFTANYILK